MPAIIRNLPIYLNHEESWNIYVSDTENWSYNYKFHLSYGKQKKKQQKSNYAYWIISFASSFLILNPKGFHTKIN